MRRADPNQSRPEKRAVIIGPTFDIKPAVPLPRWIVRLLACAALLAAFAPAWAAAMHLTSGQWRADLCDGGGPRAAHAAHHDCCLGSAAPALPAPGWTVRAGAPTPAPSRLDASAARSEPRYARAPTRAPPGLR
jgi:hypothetical protein